MAWLMGGLVRGGLTYLLSPQTCPEVDEEGFTVQPDATQNNILLAPSGGTCWHSKDKALSTVIHSLLASPLCAHCRAGGGRRVTKPTSMDELDSNSVFCYVGSGLSKRERAGLGDPRGEARGLPGGGASVMGFSS